MPPQRRKIVPPTTTSKARKKVAGANRKTESIADSAAESTAESTAPEPVGTEPVSTEPLSTEPPTVDLSKAETTKAETTQAETAKAETTSTAAAPATATAGRRSWTGVAVVGAVAVVLAAFAVVAAFEPGAKVDNTAWVDQGATSEVTREAEDALTALYTYSDATVDQDFDKARAYLNPEMLAEFDRVADTTKSAVQQTQTATQADISDIGVTRLESDKAELVAVLNVSATQGGVAQGNAEGPIVVNMEKTDGKWILSAISDS
ncbi:hypothetical protein [Rhodococcoides yunnanense]|uniref:hypothetical protein n=1 Tax=Rhodococcoides yunnanense TaxID=278209 RepID=UPI000933E1B3|nr:hypothetical protein [Rhodococcus yunnanensis]